MDVDLEVDVRAGRSEVDGLRKAKALRVFLHRIEVQGGGVDAFRICVGSQSGKPCSKGKRGRTNLKCLCTSGTRPRQGTETYKESGLHGER